MGLESKGFQFEYLPTEVVFGRGCVRTLGERLDAFGFSRPLVVCGKNVGANRAVIEPVKAALRERGNPVFAQTTPAKKLQTVFDGARRIAKEGVDCVVAVGSGSSINVARVMCLVESLDRSTDEIVSEIRQTGTVPAPNPNEAVLPNIVVPTTMAGADLTYDGGITLSEDGSASTDDEDERISASFADSRLMPAAVLYDPELFATTPTNILTQSAMNGFDKGLETVYSRESGPIAQAHALQGLLYLQAGLPKLRTRSPGDDALGRSVIGLSLVQYGRKTNIIHAFGNGVSDRCDVHQGLVHGIVAPHVLEYVFDCVDADRYQIATALGLSTASKTDSQLADAVVSAVIDIRDGLGLPACLRDVDGIERADVPTVARAIAQNRKHSRNPPGVSPSTDDVARILDAA